ncbi:hypothetical protein BCR35DRAFT_303610 [Leucosporidium creatinivorum]|uniref:Nudix hydrolase domain-containing protein n=1 Tax=Leucosporidium creatinivorum TaxID=106004 RepID=A0A1Y2FHU9_9BASI|nr:hypothetical protein BCR35DRAFT_303610 [Leucosporidium creatinivorum]
MSAFSPPTYSSQLPLQQSSFSSLTLEHTLEDLCARFIVNLPAEELESMDRVCFQIEQAHWYYEDFIRPAAINPSLLPSYGLKAFSLLMFRSCPLLHDLIPNHPQIWTSFMAYKERVPVCGAILISEFWDKVLLVKGWQKGSSWSFPRGKINKEEPEGLCAIREVLEETGYDLSSSFPLSQLQHGWVEEEGAERIPYYVELVIKEQKIRLYFIPGVEEDTYFETRTRKEISKIDWFKLSDLPTWSRDKKGKNKINAPGTGAQKQAKFYMVTPFISHLKLWIERNKPKNLRPRNNAHLNGQHHPRPVNPTPHAGLTHALSSSHQLPPHLNSNSNLHFDSDLDRSGSSVGSTEEETDGDGGFEGYGADGRRRLQQFETKEEGTEALKAFFFGGGEPASAVEGGFSSAEGEISGSGTLYDYPTPLDTHDSLHSPDLPDPRNHLARNNDVVVGAGGTPPQVAYERQSSFVQPRPKPTPQHTSTLLALLTDKNPVASPPPAKAPRRSSRHSKEQSPSSLSHPPMQPPPPPTGPTDGGSLLSILRGGPQPSSYPSPPAAPSILFADSAPPPEAAGFGTTHVLTEAERGDSEREEKKMALMRALFSVANSSRTPPPPSSARATPAGVGMAKEEVRALFQGKPLEVDGLGAREVDENGWPLPHHPERRNDDPSFRLELDGLRRRHEESFTSPSGSAFSPTTEHATPTAERWRVEALEQDHSLPADGGVGGGQNGLLGGYAGYGRLPFPGEQSPLPAQAVAGLAQRVSEVHLGGGGAIESDLSSRSSGEEGRREPGRAAASASLLSILNKPVNKSTVNLGLHKQPSFSSASAAGMSSSAYSHSPHNDEYSQQSSAVQLPLHAPVQNSPLAPQPPPLPQPPQRQQQPPFACPPISAAYPPSHHQGPPPPPQQPFYSQPPPQLGFHPQQLAFSNGALPPPPQGSGPPQLVPIALPMGYAGVPMGMRGLPFPPPQPGFPPFAGAPQGFAPPQGQGQQGQGFFASPPLQHQQPPFPPPHLQQQQPPFPPQQQLQQGFPPFPPSAQAPLPPPQAGPPPPQQQHSNANQLLGLFNAKPAASRVG